MQLNSVKFYEVSSVSPPVNCSVPASISSSYTPDKRTITLNWKAPADASVGQTYQIKDWQKKVIWQGMQLSWVDKSLPGTAGKFTYFLSSVCSGKVSTDVQQDVIIPEVTQCNPPMNIISNYSADKKSITLNWTAPNSSLPVTRYEVRDWLKRVTWQGSALSWVDHSLPGQEGNFIYFLNAVCDTKTSTMIEKDVNIQ